MRILQTVIAAAVLSTPVLAQTPAPASHVSQRIRVVADELGTQPVEGVIVATSPESLVVALARPLVREGRMLDTVTLARGSILGLEVHAGTHRNPLNGFRIGGAAGAAIGAAIGAGRTQDCRVAAQPCANENNRRAQSAAWGAIAGGISGAVVGLAIGALVESDSWRPTTLSSVLQMQIAPRAAGIRVTIPMQW